VREVRPGQIFLRNGCDGLDAVILLTSRDDDGYALGRIIYGRMLGHETGDHVMLKNLFDVLFELQELKDIGSLVNQK
jgi:hypothetical protein